MRTPPLRAYIKASTTRQRHLKSTCHENFVGNLELREYAQVGGNLFVDGDLTVHGPLLCLGRLTVTGELFANEVVVGLGMEVGGDIRADSIEAYAGYFSFDSDLQSAASNIAWRSRARKPRGATDDNGLEWITDASTLQDLEYQWYGDDVAITAGGDCIVAGPVIANGYVRVAGQFNPDDCWVHGDLYSRTVLTEGDLYCYGHHNAKGWVRIEGELHVGKLQCRHLQVWTSVYGEEGIVVWGGDTVNGDDNYRSTAWDSEEHPKKKEEMLPSIECDGEISAESISAAGSIRADGSIEARGGHVRANGSITSAGSITVPKDFGILAGLDVARSRWLNEGYVCAPAKPMRILTGAYRPLARKRKGLFGLKPARLA
jgi:predicted acyltransferase (DUF342 family)